MLTEGDCALIGPSRRHKIFKTGDVPLKVICVCAPAYSDPDTHLT